MNSEHQALTDVPLWLLVLLSLAGLSGEMLRASGSDLGLRQILQRVALRFLASGLMGVRARRAVLKRLTWRAGFLTFWQKWATSALPAWMR
ncbi:phage holin family protein [Pseudomonas sp. S09G 359]|jgi:hypothetical protein|uniref:phage holin family protein n=1 Tax=Pseudomonas sp. S09G 359 TaxID=2054919 RepID=UPI0012FEA7B3|nr:phage holin family protein [Pseudomonas sp. S09G 359]